MSVRKDFDMANFKKFLFIVPVMAALMALTAPAARATDLDLTAGGSGSLQPGIDLFTTTDSQSTGTGVIQSFVRISTNNDTVQGYNTDARPLQFDENSSPQFTRSLQLSNVPTVTIGGVVYREFLLDINQTGADPLISLNELQIFMGNTGSPIGATVGAGGTLNFGSQATLIYDMDANGDNTIELNYLLNAGSGSGDLFVYIKDSLFTGGTNVTLYSKFGDPNNNNDGFEEWAVRTTTTVQTPEPTSITLLGSGLLGLYFVVRRRLMS
jgi:hypothetical protein